MTACSGMSRSHTATTWLPASPASPASPGSPGSPASPASPASPGSAGSKVGSAFYSVTESAAGSAGG